MRLRTEYAAQTSAYARPTATGMCLLQYLRKSLSANRVFSRFILFNPASSLSFLLHYIMLRTLLSIIFSNRRRHNEFNFYQKEILVEVVDSDLTFETIQKISDVSRFFVRSVLLRIKNREDETSASRSDRSEIFFIRDKRHILRIARRNSKIIYRDLMQKIEVICSHDIIYRLLKEKNITN